MINVYSPTETNFKNNGLATLIPISCDFGIGVNDKWQLTMEHPFDKELRYQHLVENAFLRVTGVSCVNELEQDTERFGLNGKVQLYRVFDTKKTLTSVTVIAFPVAFEAVYDTPIESLVIQNKTGIEAGEILDAQTQKYSVSSDITRTASSKYENTNLIGAISGNNDDSYINKWGGEVVYDNYKIKIKNKTGDQNNASAYPIRYGRNLTGLTHEIDMSSVVTRIFPISSDDLRLNVWEDVTSQGGNRYVDSPDHINDYPFIRCMFVEVDYSLLDTNSNSISETATATNGWREGIINAITAQATALWTSIIQDLTNAYSPEYIQDLINGEDGVVGYLQRKYVYSHKGWQSFVKSCAKQGVEWIKDEALPTWEWHENTSVIPHAWWYGDNSVDPAVSYAKNEYVKIGKNYEYFNNDGYWEDYKAMPHADCDWYEAKDGSGRKWFGYRKGYYAHNEYVYMTVEGQMKEWWYDEEGWYDESRSGDSDMGWHGDATSGYWFGEADATSEDTNKFLHDRWAWIDGNYYWFDQYGYISGELDIPDYPWFVIETTQGSWFGNDQDEMLGAKWFANQWAKIDGEWYYFDADGYVVDMTAKKSETIAWFANTVYNNTIEYITTCLTNAYTLLYRLMTEWCEKQYADGIDLPTVNVSVDLIDLSKTTEYKDYSNLEKISLGDKVLVIGRDGSRYEERVVGLTFDCIRGYNTQIEVGQLSKSVSQIINVSYSGASEGQKIIAGDGVTIDGKVISVGDYVGRTIGLQDVLLNGSTTVSGNVASFGIQAGENISISRDGNVLTINSTAEEGIKVYVGTTEPSNSIGSEHDIYFQYEETTEDVVTEYSEVGGGMVSYEVTRLDFNRYTFNQEIRGNNQWDHVIYPLHNLIEGETYTISFIHKYTNGYWYTAYEDRIYVSDGNTESGVILSTDNNPHDYSFTFVAGATNLLVFSYPKLQDGMLVNSDITNFTISGRFTGDIIEIYGKIQGRWLNYQGGETYTDFIGTDGETNGESGLVPQPLTTDANKFLKSDGTWAEVQGGGGSNLILNAVKYSTEEQVVGVWIDGKPLYRKSFATNITLNSNTWVTTGDSVPNGVIARTEVYIYNLDGNTIPVWGNIDANGDVWLLNIRGSSSPTINYYTLWYTKTTDAVGSGGFQAYGFSPIIYSEEEREVGVWIDNKPLYQKTFDCGALLNAQTKEISFTEDMEMATIIDAFAMSTNEGYIISIPDVVPNYVAGSVRIYISKTNKKIYIYSQADMRTYDKSYVTILYTKTTDVAGSGSYTTLGVPTHHYDGNEKVVGTYYGETLYEKSYIQQLSNGSTSIDISDLNADYAFIESGFYDIGVTKLALNEIIDVNSRLYTYTHINTGSQYLNIDCKNTISATSTIHITIRYTKTS